jgi:transposase
VQYGPLVKAAAVHLTQHHMLPAQRTAAIMGDLCGLPLSDATVLAAVAKAAALLEPTVAAIGQAIIASPVVNADETGMRVDSKLAWLHVLATTLLTWMASTPNAAAQPLTLLGCWPTSSERWSMTAGSRTATWPACMLCATPTTCAS